MLAVVVYSGRVLGKLPRGQEQGLPGQPCAVLEFGHLLQKLGPRVSLAHGRTDGDGAVVSEQARPVRVPEGSGGVAG